MRWILAGLLLLLTASPLLAQTKGEVESIGFGGYYRPDCWTPMIVRIRPGQLQAGTYQIQVEQPDLDEDPQIFTRTITVNAAEASREQRFSMYFLPKSANGGLPDANAGGTLRDLNAELKVWLCNEKGKQLEPLPITSTIRSIDAGLTMTQRPLGRKFVLCVSDGTSRPSFDEYTATYGVTEDLAMIPVRPHELPESALGYDGVDAIVWMNGDAHLLVAGGSNKLPALTEWVRLGGRLVVTQPADRGNIETLEPLLPIELKDAGGNWLLDMKDHAGLKPLRDWIRPLPSTAENNPWLDPKGKPVATYKVARAASVKRGAMVAETIDWNDGAPNTTPDPSPFIVRGPLGLGQVTWVAQNLGDRALVDRVNIGWIGVWDKVLDLKNAPRRIYKGMPRADEDKIRNEVGNTSGLGNTGGTTDLGYSLLDQMDHSARGAGLVVIAIAFFVIYWAVAGPISYFVLANKRRKGASWPTFAASAIAATLLTVGVVKLVMGASGDIHHVTFVRWTPDQPAVVESRLGVYITKSGRVQFSLNDTDPNFASYVSAFNPHPILYKGAGGFVGKQPYDLWVGRDNEERSPTELSVPFRSTLKKLQARWTGKMNGIDGRPVLTESKDNPPVLSGRLVNSTGRDLMDVYIVYTARRIAGGDYEDRVIYLPTWSKEAQIDLAKDLPADGKSGIQTVTDGPGFLPRTGRAINDKIVNHHGTGWTNYWFRPLRNDSASGPMGDGNDPGAVRSFPLISLYERLSVISRELNTGRADIQRRGARKFDMSPAVSAGNLVILAQDAANDKQGKTTSTIPFPLEVDGDKIPGSGVTFYQFALPLTRVQPAPPPATQPATAPTTQDVEK